MKTYIASIIGITAFISFISYATIQTKAMHDPIFSDQSVAVDENINTPSIPTHQISNEQIISDETQNNTIANVPAITYTPPIVSEPLEYLNNEYGEYSYDSDDDDDEDEDEDEDDDD